jgi:hypothetical protein
LAQNWLAADVDRQLVLLRRHLSGIRFIMLFDGPNQQ